MTTWLKRPKLTWLGLGAALSALALPAQAQMATTTASDIVVRSGPGQDYPEIGLATRGSPAMMDGCLEGGNWCRIEVNGMRGWVFAEYLTIRHNGTPVVVQDYRSRYDVPAVTYESTSSIAPPAPVPGPDDIMLGPVGTVDVVDPPDTVISYIEQHPAETIRVRNELVVGATLPPDVMIREVPDYEYDYVVVNDRPVLVDPGSRRIVHIYD
ncbi:DUF1236 domain-containing protein [Rhizobium puerariae]|uniref:DUF1236 domain-containing protein n=1 Tax=Rhizobium puerariae TaxID=1585791 RepID=A0ABV6ABR0_9HYPH